MSALYRGYLTGPVIGALWMLIAGFTTAVVMSFSTGEAFRPLFWPCLLWGAVLWPATWAVVGRIGPVVAGLVIIAATFLGLGPIVIGAEVTPQAIVITGLMLAIGAVWPLKIMLAELPIGPATRHTFEEAVIRFLTGAGYVIFTALVAIPFYVMVMTSLKNQQQLVQNPLDFSIDISRGWSLFSSYVELFSAFNFGSYLWTSFYVSVLTVIITLLFSVPGAYAVARLRFSGRQAFSRSILLIYMVPMIVLA
ncbi:MAG: carbohydrate ABC transporter permease, partial [Pseudomonadota bacterium]